MSQEGIEAIERQIGELTSELGALRKASEGEAIRNGVRVGVEVTASSYQHLKSR